MRRGPASGRGSDRALPLDPRQAVLARRPSRPPRSRRRRSATSIEEIATPHRLLDVEIAVERDGPAPEPICRRNAGMIYGLTNLVENAVELRREPGRDPRVLDEFDRQDRHRRRRAGLSRPGPGAPGRALHLDARRARAGARASRGRHGPGAVHRQCAARAFRRVARDRQCAAPANGRRGDDRLAARRASNTVDCRVDKALESYPYAKSQ